MANDEFRSPTSKTPWYAHRWRVLIWLPLGYLLIVVTMMFLENGLIFFPVRYPDGYWRPGDIAPQDAWFQAADGTRLHGWYLPHPDPRAAVLFCHGNAGNITHRIGLLRVLNDRVGVSVLIFDYRGYGRSEGSPSESGVYQDVRAARDWLAEHEGIEPADVVLMGRSLGGAVAVDLAADQGAKALVLESTSTSIPDVAAYHYPWLPVRILMRNKFDSLAKITSYEGPLLASHGDRDEIIPYKLGRRLFEAANQPKQFMTITGGQHNEPQPAEFYDALIRLLDNLDQEM